jgi:putative SOS response-associated peptidase YedK
MCGRVRLSSDYSEIRIQLRLPEQADAPNFGPNWNGAPTQTMPVARLDPETKQRRLDQMRWGLLPFWAKDQKLAYSTFNARAEALQTLPTFREAYKRGRRCLVPVDSFYEWKTLTGPKDKQPYAIGRVDKRLTVMAGLWESWKSPDGETIRSFTIITTTPNPFMAALHTRMPVILPEASWPIWLGETDADADTVKALLAPYPADDLIAWPVDRRVGNVRNNDAGLIEAIAA